MKLAVIIGVIQMTFGVVLKGMNNVYYRHWVDLFLEFIPQLLFITCIFGWMIVMIVIKWVVQADGNHANLITAMINLALQVGKADSQTAVLNTDLQTDIQRVLLGVGVLCIPIMLLGKPIVLSNWHDSKRIQIKSIFPLSKPAQEHSFGELFVHQMIETIE